MATLSALPSSLVQSTTVEYTRNYSDFPASAGWGLKLHIAGPAVQTVIGVPSGDSFTFTLDSTTTGALLPGRYVWEERATKATVVQTAATGTLIVTADIAAATAGQMVTASERQLALLEAALERRYAGGGDMEAFSVGGRSVNLIPTKELEGMRNRARWAVMKERNGGRIPPRKITFPGV